jgi:hypothetical protein
MLTIVGFVAAFALVSEISAARLKHIVAPMEIALPEDLSNHQTNNLVIKDDECLEACESNCFEEKNPLNLAETRRTCRTSSCCPPCPTPPEPPKPDCLPFCTKNTDCINYEFSVPGPGGSSKTINYKCYELPSLNEGEWV